MKKFYTLALMLLSITVAKADQLTPQEAMARLNSSSSQSTARKAAKANAAGQLSLTYTSTSDGLNTYYVFNNAKGGYLLLSADDCLPAVLGTVSTGSFDYDQLPPNMRWFLSLYDKAVVSNSKSGVKAKTSDAEPIEPLLFNTAIGNIQWNQKDPYNLMCPTYNGERTLTGCVATAMAQVMAYYEWPKKNCKGYSEYKYEMAIGKDKNGDITYAEDSFSISMNFDTVKFDWDNMRPNKAAYTTDEEKHAIALLMSSCGIASNMEYGLSAGEGSGSSSYCATYAMPTYFDYDKSIQCLNHDYFTNDEWDQMIYDELYAKRPVILCGANVKSQGGHAFVCDGYDDGLFHINWGWGGEDDSYFYLAGSRLNNRYDNDDYDEDDDMGFNLDAVVGIKPNEGGEFNGTKFFTCGYRFSIEDNTVLEMSGTFKNYYYDKCKVKLGVELVSDNNTIYAFESKGANFKTGDFTSRYKVTIPKSRMKAGEKYAINPIYSEDDGETFAYVKCTPQQEQFIELEGDSVSDATKYDYVIDDDAKVSFENRKYYTATENDTDTIVIKISGDGVINKLKDTKIQFGAYLLNTVADTIDFYIYDVESNIIDPEDTISEIYVPISDYVTPGTYYVCPVEWTGLLETFSNDAVADYVANTSTKMFVVTESPTITIIEDSDPVAVEDIVSSSSDALAPKKILRDGRILIRRDSHLYSPTGQKVR